MAKPINLIITDPVKRASLEKRFWQKVKKAKPEECWEWTASKNEHGYGNITSQANGKNVTLRSSQVSYSLANGTIPDHLCVLHQCDNPGCCNPNHLFLGTNKDNSQDSVKKGRSSKPPMHRGEKQHLSKLTEEDVRKILKDPRLMYVIANEYGVAACTISAIKNGRLWKHVEREQ